MSYRMSKATLTGMDRETLAHFANSMSAVEFYQWLIDRIQERISEMTENYTIAEMYELRTTGDVLLMDLLSYRRKAIESFTDDIKELEME